MIQPPGREAVSLATVDSFGAARVAALYASDRILLTHGDASGRSVLTAQSVDLTVPRLVGEPSVLLTDVNAAFSASTNGVLAFAQSQFQQERIYWLDAKGAVVTAATGRLELFNFDLSPDERSLVIEGVEGRLQLHDLTRGVTTTLAPGGADPVWSGDGTQVAFAISGGSEAGLHVMPAFGGASRRVYEPKTVTYLDDWSRDGAWLAGHVGAGAGPGILVPMATGEPILFETGDPGTGVDETRFSPDGRWLAYGLNRSGSGDVFLIPLPPTGARWQVSVGGGAQPRWRHDGRALFFLSLSGTMMQVDFQAKPGAPPQISAPRALFDAGLQVQVGLDQYAVNRDGTRFLVRRPEEGYAEPLRRIDVIVNWPALLKASP
jgi:dipeptidyl aminopeptidase/acylaminoacyl peptidase